jgi:DNA-binding beta-propeller fold protein YncE
MIVGSGASIPCGIPSTSDLTNIAIECLPVLPSITGGGLSGPYGVAIDSRGKLYVANTKNSSLSIFDTSHRYAPLLVITRSLKHPAGVTVH